jgi:hypothetical protein
MLTIGHSTIQATGALPYSSACAFFRSLVLRPDIGNHPLADESVLAVTTAAPNGPNWVYPLGCPGGSGMFALIITGDPAGDPGISCPVYCSSRALRPPGQCACSSTPRLGNESPDHGINSEVGQAFRFK